MLYRHTKTGRIIDVESEIGGNWEKVVAPSTSEPARKAPKKSAKKTKDEKPDG